MAEGLLSTPPHDQSMRWHRAIQVVERAWLHESSPINLNFAMPQKQNWMIPYEDDGQPYSDLSKMR
jgi:hypothetical protein